MVRLVQVCSDGRDFECVKVNDVVGKNFDSFKGVRQGVLCLLFNADANYAENDTNGPGKWIANWPGPSYYWQGCGNLIIC